MPEESDGPCRKVGRSRKRSASTHQSVSGEDRHSKCQRSLEGQIKANIVLHKRNETISNDRKQASFVSTDKISQERTAEEVSCCVDNTKMQTDTKTESSNDLWFTNSFMNEKYHQNKTTLYNKNNTAMSDINQTSKVDQCKTDTFQKLEGSSTSGVRRGRVDLKLSVCPAPREVLQTQTGTRGSRSNESIYFQNTNDLRPPTSHKDDFFHSTPVRNQQAIDSSYDDVLNNSDALLADIVLGVADSGKKTIKKSSATVIQTEHKGINQHLPDNQPVTTVSSTVNDIQKRSLRSTSHTNTQTVVPKCPASNSNIDQLNSSGSDLFEEICHDGDFLSQIEDLEKQIDETVFSSVTRNEPKKVSNVKQDLQSQAKVKITTEPISNYNTHTTSISEHHESRDIMYTTDKNIKEIEDLEKQINETVFSRVTRNERKKASIDKQDLQSQTKGKVVTELISNCNTSTSISKNSHESRDLRVTVNENIKETVSKTLLPKLAIETIVPEKPCSVTVENRLTVKTPQSPVTPLGAAGGSLKDRIKRKLQENAGTKLLNSPGVLQLQMREDVVQRAQTEAEQMKKEGSGQDTGPFYGLPSKVQKLLQNQRGIKELYDWQDECLMLPAVIQSRNLIYSLPTSGGKTLVAEILIMRELLCKKRDAMLVLPFVSIVQEKVRGMSQLSVELDFLVEEYAGSKGRFPPIRRRQKKSLYIATIEKSHTLINSLLENKRLDELGLVVVDELHMLGEGGSRGAVLEAALLKLIYSNSNTQIIGMSATLSNIADLQTFLHADVYSNDFRPVELTEYVKLQDNIYQVQPKAKCPDDQLFHDRVVPFPYTPEMTKVDPDHLLGLVMEVIPARSCLVFCPTKKNCENVAMMLCKLMVKHHHELCGIKKAEKRALLKELYNDGVGKICPTLQYTVHFGLAYHHSGLTTDERKLIEEAYSEGTLCLLTCTSTLAAGVNLPAKRVILRSPYVGSQFISRSQYKQMVGRAGRAGIDSSGESILILKTSDSEKVSNMLMKPMEACNSSLGYDENKGIRTLILSTIGLQLTPTTSDVFKCLSQTLLNVQTKDRQEYNITEVTQSSLQQLIDLNLVVQKRSLSQENDSPVHQLEVTPLGRATFKGSVNLDYAERLYKDLLKAEESLSLASHLHLLYLVTPYDMVDMIKPVWIIYFQEISTLSPVEMKVATLIGVTEGYITKKASGRHTKQVVDDFVVVRFYLTLMIYGLWKQKSVWEVAERFQQPRGFIQNLLSSASSFASCVFHFCQELDEFWAYQDLLGNFVKRLAYCVTAELIPLMEIPGVKLGRAKQLYSCGYRTLSMVANADPDAIVKAVTMIPCKTAKQIVMSAKMVLNEKAEALLQEVESLVAVPRDAEPAFTTEELSQTSLASVTSSELLVNLQDFQEELT